MRRRSQALSTATAACFGSSGSTRRLLRRFRRSSCRPPRIVPPAALAPHCSSDPYDRAAHTYGKSFSDYARGLAGQYDNAPDVVAYPRNEAEVAAVIDWAGGAQAAVIPFGAGSSVVGGVEPRLDGGCLPGGDLARPAASEPGRRDRPHLARRAHRGRRLWPRARGAAEAA